MAQIPSTSAFSEGDGLNTYVNIDTVNKILGVWNGAGLKFYSDAGSTVTMQMLAGILALAQSATTPDPGAGGTINTANLGVSRVTPAASRTGCILQAGTQPGQLIVVQNESGSNSITFAAQGTSNVQNGTSVVLPAGMSQLFEWDGAQSMWMPLGLSTTNGTMFLVQSATTPDPGAGGTINTAGVGIARITPAAARTGVILQAGTMQGQLVIVRNEGSQANSITFAASGTSNVADGVNDIIPGGQDALFEWSTTSSLWNRIGNPLVSGGLQPTIASATAPDPGANGTVNTAGVGRARVSPAANRAGCILQAGTFDGQEVWVVNEAASNTISWATQATSNIGGESGGTFVLAAKGAQKFVWDGSDSLWHKAA